MRSCWCAILLGGVLLCPLATRAIGQEDHRYYDADRKDYHEWNENENRAWRHWLEEHHYKYHEWARADKKEQRGYWKWRHEHPDWH